MQTVALIIVLQVLVVLLAGCTEFEAKIEEMNIISETQNDGFQE